MKIANIEFPQNPVFLAPMEDVTNPAFRMLCKRFGADMVYTEFISCDALIRDIPRTLQKLTINEAERPVAIQIYGREPGPMADAARMAESAHPDIIDINFTPVTVKTRLGWDEDNKIIVDLAEQLQDCGIQALAIHGRTRSQMYKGEADWTLIGEVKNNQRMHIPIIGNGDVTTPERARECFDRYGVDAIMVGRASIGCPWITAPLTFEEKKEIIKGHVLSTIDWLDERRGILHVRRHLAATPIFKGIPNFKDTRIAMLRAETKEELFRIIDGVSL